MRPFATALIAISLLSSSMIYAQDVSSAGTLPRLVRFSGQISSSPNSSTSATLNFAVFTMETGGDPVWQETQTVKVDSGKFTVLLGSTQPEGLPQEPFTSGEARWMEWSVAGQAPERRVRLISVPYALNAGNAETFAGHTLSEFVMSQPSVQKGQPSERRAQREGQLGTATSGAANMVAKFDGATSTVASEVFDNGSAVGIGTVTPSQKLEVVGNIKVSGAGNGIVFPDGSTLGSDIKGGITSRNIEQVRFPDQFLNGSLTGGIAEAYADCPSSGCKIQLGQDIVILTPQIITVTKGKPLVLDLAGRSITAANNSGIGLTFTTDNINYRTPMTLSNGSLNCAWSNTGLVGFAWSSFVNVSIDHLDVRNCNTAGSLAILWDFVEDAHMSGVGFRSNAGAIRLQNSTNQVSFRDVWFDSNVNPMVIQDSVGVTLEDCLVQSNSGAHAVQVVTSPGSNATTIRVHKCHFENNGDGSSNSRNIYVAPSPSQVILGISIEDNVFTAGAYGAQGISFEAAGSQNVAPVTFKNNQYNGYGPGKMVTGLQNGSRVTSIGENVEVGDYGYDAGINTHGLAGMSFAPQGGSRAYQMYAGWPNGYDGFLQFWDVTGNSSILNYSSASSSWNFPKTAVFQSSVIFSDSQNIYGYSDNAQTSQKWGVTGATGAARFDGGANLGTGLTINGGSSLVTSEQTGIGKLVLANGAVLVDPKIGNAIATSLVINGDNAMNSAPRMVYSTSIINPTMVGLQSRWTPDRPIVITRFQLVLTAGQDSACSTPATLQLIGGAVPVGISLTNGDSVFDSGPVNISVSPSSNLDIQVSGAASGCATVATFGNATVQYRMM